MAAKERSAQQAPAAATPASRKRKQNRVTFSEGTPGASSTTVAKPPAKRAASGQHATTATEQAILATRDALAGTNLQHPPAPEVAIPTDDVLAEQFPIERPHTIDAAEADELAQRQSADSTEPLPDLSWLREESQYWSYIPKCMEDSLMTTAERIAKLHIGLGASVHHIESLYELIAAPLVPNEARAALNKSRKVRKRLQSIVKAVQATSNAAGMISSNHKILMQRHNEMMREMLGHLHRDAVYAPDRPGSSLIATPHRWR